MDKSNKPFETEEKGVGLCPDCAVETGTIFDGTDRTAAVSRLFETEQAAAVSFLKAAVSGWMPNSSSAVRPRKSSSSSKHADVRY